ncbi:MAG: fibronectin type III domain-containing protein [Actinobacteria bacterium]|nr:fibronectin type III domain-containing protein [Actinomycetota bacterium]
MNGRCRSISRLVVVGLILVVLGGVVPAATAQAPVDCPDNQGTSRPTGTIYTPTKEQVVQTSTTTVTGCYEYGSDALGPLGTITKVTVSLVAGRGQVLPKPASQVFEVTPPARAYKFEWRTDIAWNGPYTVKVVVNGNARPPGGSHEERAESRFFIEVPPDPPKGLKATPEGEDGVTVSWDKNTEPDIVGYEVHRAPKDGDFAPIAQAAGNLTKLNDRPSVGEWRYVVVAIRRGAGDKGVASGPSAVANASVVTPPAPSTSTTTAAGGGGDGGGGGGAASPTTIQKTGSGIVITSTGTGTGGGSASGGRGSRVDLSGFSSLNRPTTNRIEAPDPGFEEALPFAPGDEPAVGSEDEEELGADDPNRDRALGQRYISDESDRRRSLTFVAFGLLLFVMSMSGLWVRGEVKRADELETLDPEPQRPGHGGSGPARPVAGAGPRGPSGPPAGAVPGSLTAFVGAAGAKTEVSAPRPVVPPPLPARAVAPSTGPSAEGTAVGPFGGGHAQRSRDRNARRAARRSQGGLVDEMTGGVEDERRGTDPLDGMAPMSPPPPRPWSSRQPVDAPALDVPDPDADSEPSRPRRAGRSGSERRLPVR